MTKNLVDTTVAWMNNFVALKAGLADMIQGGRLSRDIVPDDYDWLIETLTWQPRIEDQFTSDNDKPTP